MQNKHFLWCSVKEKKEKKHWFQMSINEEIIEIINLNDLALLK